MTELFEIYQDNIKILFGKITRILENANMYSSDKLDTSLTEADAHVKEAERLIKNMEVQSMSFQISENNHSLALRNYKSGIDAYKKRILKVKESLTNNKKLDSMILTTDSSTQKEKLINNEELVWNSFDKLERAKRSTIEMENVSIEVARELNSQNEKMKSIGGKVVEINNEISSSTGLIARMTRLQMRNKLIIVCFSISLILIFIFILFIRLSSSSSTSSTSSSSTTPSNTNILNTLNATNLTN
jgi:predicted RND superfamily exporter protein